MIKVIYSKKSGKCDIVTGKCDIGRINDKGDIFKERKAILDVLMENAKMRLDACINDKGDIFKEVRKMRYWRKMRYSKRSGKCDIGRINDKGDIFKEASKMRYWTPVLMIKVIYSKKSGKCDIGLY